MKGSVFIMDGAKIHLDLNIVNYLRSTGLYVLFLLPACVLPILQPDRSGIRIREAASAEEPR